MYNYLVNLEKIDNLLCFRIRKIYNSFLYISMEFHVIVLRLNVDVDDNLRSIFYVLQPASFKKVRNDFVAVKIIFRRNWKSRTLNSTWAK